MTRGRRGARPAAVATAVQARDPRPSPPTATIVAHDVGTAGGMERQLGELCGGLLARGHRVVVVARRCELAPHPRLRVVRVRTPRRPFALAYPAFFVAGSWAVLRHGEGLLHTTGAVVANRADVSTVHFCHDGFRRAAGAPRHSRDGLAHRVNAAVAGWMSRLAERACLRAGRTRRLVAVSAGVARELTRLRSDAATVIPNGVDHDRFAPDAGVRAQGRARLALGPDELVALFVGGDWERKGLRVAIDALSGAPGWRLVVVGRGDAAAAREHARRAGVGERLHLAGPVPDPERWYAAADAFVLPTAYEAFPLVMLEAAAVGLPLLVGHVNGAEELVEPGRNGWFVRRDGGEIAARLRELAADPRARERMGGAARAASARYTWERVVDAYADLYDTLDATPR